jgi:hypothetical protein
MPELKGVTLIISPENIKNERKKNIFYRLSPKFLRKLADKQLYKASLRKWSHHGDSRQFDWDWKSINFNRVAIVSLLASKMDNPKYLEIGCASNSLFNCVPTLNKVGVDPAAGGTIRKTSDEFFETNTEKFHVVFIDGLHTYEQVRRDIQNSLNCIEENGWIALHDMLPRNWIEHHVPIVSRRAWTGDVWKVAFELCETGGIDFRLIKIDHGVGVIKVNRPGVTLCDKRATLSEKEFSFYYDNIDKLPLIDFQQAYQWIKA